MCRLFQLKMALTLFGAIMCGQLLFSQSTIRGVISDGETGELYPFAKVILTRYTDSTQYYAKSNFDGRYQISAIPQGVYFLTVRALAFEEERVDSLMLINGQVLTQDVTLLQSVTLSEVMIVEKRPRLKRADAVSIQKISTRDASSVATTKSRKGRKSKSQQTVIPNTESYSSISENGFKKVTTDPLSTFSVDVDAASYSNVRRFINQGSRPDKDAVRVEEMINYFEYDYPDPVDEHPFSINTEVGHCPWNKKTHLVHIGLQGDRMNDDELPATNLVFLLDVSGSMGSYNKLPLLKESFELLVEKLRPEDRVAIVVYAGAAGLVLESTAGNKKSHILESINRLESGGSTAGGAGIELAYKVATENFIPDGNNRVILATDGDFNVGRSSDGSMKQLIEEKRKTGVFLTCLGFGYGNYKDSKLETLADAGNGNYAYIDDISEAKKVLVTEMGGTLFTIAKDVKIQLEFNPATIQRYRLVGYENRLLENEDFADDTKDAGEIGAGHSVTAIYEVEFKDGRQTEPDIDDLRYNANENPNLYPNELLTVKFRYKKADGNKSILLQQPVYKEVKKEDELSNNYLFSAAVAEFGMLLRDSKYKKNASFDHVLKLAKQSKGDDQHGYRKEFIQMVKAAEGLFASNG